MFGKNESLLGEGGKILIEGNHEYVAITEGKKAEGAEKCAGNVGDVVGGNGK